MNSFKLTNQNSSNIIWVKEIYKKIVGYTGCCYLEFLTTDSSYIKMFANELKQNNFKFKENLSMLDNIISYNDSLIYKKKSISTYSKDKQNILIYEGIKIIENFQKKSIFKQNENTVLKKDTYYKITVFSPNIYSGQPKLGK